MRLLLRAIAVITGLNFLVTATSLLPFVLSGGLTTLIRSGAIGGLTVLAWILTLIVAPVAAVQLWQFKRSGLLLSAGLSGLAALYYLAAMLFLPASAGQGTAPVAPLVVNAASFALLLSPTARRTCVN
jgi:hypothetical protein